jgi:CRISPR-associated protein Csb2
MLAIEVEFLHGAFHAAAADDVALTGLTGRSEWPPSPARLYSALVSGGGTGGGGTMDVAGLRLLEEAAPIIRAVGPSGVQRVELEHRFAAIDESDEGSVQNYPGRVAQVVRPGIRLSLADPRVRFEWPNAHPSPTEIAELRHRAGRVGYLGCADSPVRLRVTTEEARGESLPVWRPDDTGAEVLPVPYPGFLDALDAAFTAWSQGMPRRRAWVPNRLARYRSPEDPPPAGKAERAQTVWLRFDRPIGGRLVVTVAETLRDAILTRYEEQVAGSRERVPAVLHGHFEETGKGFHHAYWVPLPHVGFPHADGRIHGACIWLPPDTPAEIVEGVRRVAFGLGRLVRPPVFDVGVAVFDGTRYPWAANPARWVGPSRTWTSVFPVVHERHAKKGPTLADVAEWCRHAGLPDPVWFRSARVPLLEGGVSLAPAEVFRPGREQHPYSHVEVGFAEPVTGPVVLGRHRHFGLGLMAPSPDPDHPGEPPGA